MRKEEDLSVKRRIYRKICTAFGMYMPDLLYLKLLYEVRMNRKLNIKNPVLFNEKMQWLKLYDRQDIYTRMADKYEVRKIVEEILGEDYLIPLLGVYDKVEDIEWEKLPEQFVLKCTHDSASVCICRCKNEFDRVSACRRLGQSLGINYFYASREWPYKNMKPRIVAEQYMADESGTELKDYKIYTFGGEPYLIQVDFDRFVNHRRNLYTTDWEFIDEEIEYPKDSSVRIKKPNKLEEMLECSRKLARGTASLRTDFYSIDDKIYFGEITFYQEAGFAHFSSVEYERKLGDMIIFPPKRF